MPPRVRAWLEDVGSSLWAAPTALTLLIVGLAWATVEVDKLMLAAGRSDLYFAFGGGAAGARGVLEAIASTTITVTGVVFSITMVAMQLASTQYTSRVLRSFPGDRGNQIVLGVFIATFTYALLVLRTVRSASQDGLVFVPSLSVGVAILLALTSVGRLIHFIHHALRSIQVSTIVDRAARDTLALIDHDFPDPFDPAQAEEFGPGGGLPIADIALRALSPGINDPTTATTCIDRLAEVLVRERCVRVLRTDRTPYC